MRKIHFKKYWTAIIVAVVIIISLGAWVIIRDQLQKHVNLAYETVSPIEKALVESGARKICSKGDAGYGIDNQSPNYGAFYETDLNLKDATNLITEVSAANGFNLSAGQSAYPEIHPYFDHTTKSSPYTQLKSGPIILGLSLYDGGDKLSCAGETIVYNKEHTAIKLDVALPEFKR